MVSVRVLALYVETLGEDKAKDVETLGEDKAKGYSWEDCLMHTNGCGRRWAPTLGFVLLGGLVVSHL